jgi:MYXO-CTERM domain-containing protein
MRKLFFLIFLAGAGLTFGYPWYVENLTGYEIGTFPAYRQSTGYTPVSVVLSSNEAPVRIFVDMTATEGFKPDNARTALTLTASTANKTILASTLNYASTSAESRSPQSTEQIFRDRAGDLKIETPGEYRFVVGEGDIETLIPKRVDIVLRANVEEPDVRAQPAGFALLGLGLIGMIRSGRRRNADPREPATVVPQPKEPEKPKWGRDAADQ